MHKTFAFKKIGVEKSDENRSGGKKGETFFFQECPLLPPYL
jgi:hypothetical protein